MTSALISLAVLVVLYISLRWYAKHGGHVEPAQPAEPVADCSSCGGGNAKCEQDCMMEASTKPVEYFDDEELDAFAGRQSDSYEPDEVEQFAYVMQTMQPGEVAAWCRSLTLRGISLPDELKDEAIMMIGDEHI